MFGYLLNFRGWMGWWALVLIAILIGLAEFLSGHPLVKKGLWTAAAGVAVVSAFNEWRSR